MFYYISFDDIMFKKMDTFIRSNWQKQSMTSKIVKDKEKVVRRVLWIK